MGNSDGVTRKGNSPTIPELASHFLTDDDWITDFVSSISELYVQRQSESQQSRCKDILDIINFFVLLVAADDSGTEALRKTSLVSRLVHYLATQTSFVWNDDEVVMHSANNARL